MYQENVYLQLHTYQDVECDAQPCFQKYCNAVRHISEDYVMIGKPRKPIFNWKQNKDSVSNVKTDKCYFIPRGTESFSNKSERLCGQIVQQFKNNLPQCKFAKDIGISSSTIHNLIKRFRESRRRGTRPENQYWMAVIFVPSGGTALKSDTAWA